MAEQILNKGESRREPGDTASSCHAMENKVYRAQWKLQLGGEKWEMGLRKRKDRKQCVRIEELKAGQGKLLIPQTGNYPEPAKHM